MNEIYIIGTLYLVYYISFLLFLTVYFKRIRNETRLKFFYTYILIKLTPNIIVLKILIPIICILYNAYQYYKDMQLYNTEKNELDEKSKK